MARRWQQRIFPRQYASLLFWSAHNRQWYARMPQYDLWCWEWYHDSSMMRELEHWRAAGENREQERSRA